MNLANPVQTMMLKNQESKQPSAKQARKKRSKANRKIWKEKEESITAAVEESCKKIGFEIE